MNSASSALDTLIVKAFNTIWYQHLADQGNPHLPIGERRVIFIAGNDSIYAIGTVSKLSAGGSGQLNTGDDI